MVLGTSSIVQAMRKTHVNTGLVAIKKLHPIATTRNVFCSLQIFQLNKTQLAHIVQRRNRSLTTVVSSSVGVWFVMNVIHLVSIRYNESQMVSNDSYSAHVRV